MTDQIMGGGTWSLLVVFALVAILGLLGLVHLLKRRPLMEGVDEEELGGLTLGRYVTEEEADRWVETGSIGAVGTEETPGRGRRREAAEPLEPSRQPDAP